MYYLLSVYVTYIFIYFFQGISFSSMAPTSSDMRIQPEVTSEIRKEKRDYGKGGDGNSRIQLI